MSKGSAVVVAVVVVFGALTSCGSDEADVIDVFAAASLTDAFTELAAAFEAANADLDVRLNFAGSSTLREQLLDGAQADVFASANMAIMDELVAEGAIDGQPVVVARNTLVLAVPVDNPGGVDSLDDLARSDLLIGICARGVPCGDLAHQLLEREGVAVAADTAESDVRSLARRLADRELDAALVYASDVTADAERLRVIDAGVSAPSTRYPIAAVDESDQARAFVDFALGPEGQAVLGRWGFGRP